MTDQNVLQTFARIQGVVKGHDGAARVAEEDAYALL
jgi:hypothetical protein